MRTLGHDQHRFPNVANARTLYAILKDNTLQIMTHLKSRTLFICFAFITFVTYGQSKKANLILSKQIDSLRNADQSPLTIKNADSAAKEFQKIIRSNFPIIKNIADKFGFPGYDLVGNESSNNYWLLVQHTDFDVSFQSKHPTNTLISF